jgi:Uma2 family endonuclease
MVASPPTIPASADQRIVLNGVPWSHYETQLCLRGDGSVPRVSYLDGAMELMSPSQDHERVKFYIGRLLEAYALETGIEFTGYGSWTLKNAPQEAGAEPDECYIIGPDQGKDTPDLAIEVVWTAGGLDKLETYRRLGVPEVWFWKTGRIQVHALRGDRYERASRSRFFPDLDLDLLVSFLDRPTASEAIRAFRKAISASKPAGRPSRRRR